MRRSQPATRPSPRTSNILAVSIKPLGNEWVWVWALLLPTLLGLLLGAVGSIAAVIGLSFVSWDLLTPPHYVGVANYTQLPLERMFVKALGNTAFFAALFVPFTLAISFLVALGLNRNIRGKSLLRALYFLPVISSPTAVGFVWSWIFSEDHGLLNAAVGLVGLGPYKWLSGALLPYAIVIANVWGAIGEGMIIFLAGLQAVPRDYYEVARIEGATPWQNLIYITLPCMLPSLFFQSVLSTIHAFQAFDYIYVLARSGNGNSTFPTLVFSIYRSGFRFFRMGEAAAQAVVLTLIILAFTLVYFQLQKRWGQQA
jgi:multiple sugar transport system permease protein